jgi:hypothetical protein
MPAPTAEPSPPERDGEEDLKGEYHALSYADLVERLFREFEDYLTLTEIADVVRESRSDLRGSPPHALPELTERLAHQRLARMAVIDDRDAERPQGASDDIAGIGDTIGP